MARRSAMRSSRRCASTRATRSSRSTANSDDSPMRRLVNRVPGRGGAWMLGALPFVILGFVYVIASNLRFAANPGDKLLPTPSVIGQTLKEYAAEEDKRSGDVLLWLDTWASLE